MADPKRILILDRNRYRLLLTERAVAEIAPASMIARFASGTEVVREILTTRCDVAILSLEGIERPVDMVQTARLARPEIKLIVSGLPETPKRVVQAMQPLVDSYLSWDSDPGAQLPESICRAIEAACGVRSGVAQAVTTTDEPVPVG